MAGPARTITPHPRHLSGRNTARTVADLTGRPRHQENSGLIGALLDGKLNTTGTIDLAVAPATTTTLSDPRIGTTTLAFFTALNAAAAVEAGLGTLYSAFAAPGSITITHSAGAGTRSFGFVLLG